MVSPIKIQKGFTLVELLVTLGILAAIIFATSLAINPSAQLKKARDAKRSQEVQELRKAFETYYQDNNCYPQESEIPWGQEWTSEEGGVYMTKVPAGVNNDDCTDASCSLYYYFTDTSACPQWYSVFSEKDVVTEATESCPVDAFEDACQPENYVINGYICEVEGNIDCDELDSEVLPDPETTPTPTPTDDPEVCDQYYACLGAPLVCNSLDDVSEQDCVQNGGDTTCYCDPSCNEVCN